MRLPSLALVVASLLFSPAAFAQELYAFVGAGLRAPVDEIITAFTAETGIAVRPEYGGSGAQLARIEETGKGDIFLPGSTIYTDKLKAKGLIGEIRVLVVHGPILAVRLESADRIKSLADVAKPGVKLGLGDAQAMALGRTAEEILGRVPYGKEALANVAVRAATVKQLATYVLDGNVDAAIIGAADAAQNPGRFVVVAIPPDLFEADRVPVAVLKSTTFAAGSERFAAYLASPKSLATFERFGFPAAK